MTRKAEQFIKDYTRGISNEIENGCYHEWLTPEQCRAACIIEREETINNACEWLFGHLSFFVTYFDEEFVEEIDRSDFIKNFRKAMEA